MNALLWQSATLLCGEETIRLSASDYRFQDLLGLPKQQYRGLQRHVLCPSYAWTKKEARRQAFRLVAAPATWRAIVMLGSKTRTAFGYWRPALSHEVSELNPDVRLVCLPSPEDRAWRDVHHVQRARQILREAIPTLAWGTLQDRFTALSYSLRCAAECAFWTGALPKGLREKSHWTDDELMVALDAAEEHGVDRTRAEYIARVSGKGLTS